MQRQCFQQYTDPFRFNSVFFFFLNATFIKNPIYMCASNTRSISEHNALLCGVCMFLLFAAFNTAQNIATSLSSLVGSTSLGILYGVNCIACLVLPSIMNRMSCKTSMFIGAISFSFFVASYIHPNVYVQYITSALLGIGSAFFWIGEGEFVALCSNQFEYHYALPFNSKLGYFNGIFQLSFQLSQFIGNLLAALLKQHGISNQHVFTIFTIICGLGTVLFLFLKPFPVYPYDVQKRLINERQVLQPTVDPMLTIKMWFTRSFLIILPMSIYSGVAQEFQFGEFPALIDGDSHTFYVLAAFGLSDAIFATIFGQISDLVGRLPIIIIATCAYGSVFAVLYLHDSTQRDLWILFVLGIVLGIGDAGYNTQILSLYPILLGRKPETYANFNFWQSSISSVCFFWHHHLAFDVKIIVYCTILTLSVLPLLLTKKGRQATQSRKGC
eukprot:474813_1